MCWSLASLAVCAGYKSANRQGDTARTVAASASPAGLGALATGLEAPTGEVPSIAIVMPHPDDEWQGWSKIAQRPEFKVFIYATRGENTGRCEPGTIVRTTGIHLPSPQPEGRWTKSCEDARINSTLGFLHGMSESDPTIPGDLMYVGEIGPLPANGKTICRTDSSETACNTTDTLSANVYADRLGRGILILFNLGDGDLKEEEIKWMLNAVKEMPELFGMSSHTVFKEFVASSYYNDSFSSCFVYQHADHLALAKTVQNNDFGMGDQFLSTCASNPDADMTMSVSASSISGFDMAFSYYDWLFYGTNLEGRARDSSQSTALWQISQSFETTINGEKVIISAPADAYAPAVRLSED